MTRMALLAAMIVTGGCVANAPMRQPVEDDGDPAAGQPGGASLGSCPEVFCVGDDGYCDDGIDCLAPDESATTCAHDPDCVPPDTSSDDTADGDPAPAADDPADDPADSPAEESFACEPGTLGTGCQRTEDCTAGMMCFITSCADEPPQLFGSCIPQGVTVVANSGCDAGDVMVPFPCGSHSSGACFASDVAAQICDCDFGTFDCSGI